MNETQVSNTVFGHLKVAPYSFTIARALRTKVQIICARSKGNVSVFGIFYYVSISTKSKTDSEFSCVSFGEIP